MIYFIYVLIQHIMKYRNEDAYVHMQHMTRYITCMYIYTRSQNAQMYTYMYAKVHVHVRKCTCICTRMCTLFAYAIYHVMYYVSVHIHKRSRNAQTCTYMYANAHVYVHVQCIPWYITYMYSYKRSRNSQMYSMFTYT